MDISLDQQSPTLALIKINLNESDYQPEVEKKIKTYSKQIQLKGFRPGKVPPGLIRKMYGKSILAEEVNQILSKSLNEYIKEQALSVVGDPLPDLESGPQIDWDNQKDFEFVYKVGMVPDYEYNLKDISVTDYQISDQEKAIEEILNNIQNQFGETVTVEESQAGDFVKGDLSQVGAEDAVETSEEGATAEEPFNQNILLPLNQVNPDEVDYFIGLKSGDIATFEIQNLFKNGAKGISLATGISEEEAEKLEGSFQFKVESITRTEPAALNPELFAKIFPNEVIESEAAFREKIQDNVKQNQQQESNQFLNIQIRKELLKNLDIQLPHDFLKEWLLVINEGKVTMEQIETEYDQFAENLKWDLFQNRVVKDAEINVENEEVEDRAREMIKAQFGGYIPENSEISQHMDALVQNYLQGQEGKNYQNVFMEVIREKAFNYLREEVSTTQAEIDREAFQELISQY